MKLGNFNKCGAYDYLKQLLELLSLRKKKKMKPKIRSIIIALNKYGCMSIKEISIRSNISWVTAKKYVAELERYGVLIRNPVSPKKFELNYEKILR